jgi:hypothetical protein
MPLDGGEVELSAGDLVVGGLLLDIVRRLGFILSSGNNVRIVNC